jgi:hypothetical protein
MSSILLQADVRHPFVQVPGVGLLEMSFNSLNEYSTADDNVNVIFLQTAAAMRADFTDGTTKRQLQVTLFFKTTDGTLTQAQFSKVVRADTPFSNLIGAKRPDGFIPCDLTFDPIPPGPGNFHQVDLNINQSLETHITQIRFDHATISSV